MISATRSCKLHRFTDPSNTVEGRRHDKIIARNKNRTIAYEKVPLMKINVKTSFASVHNFLPSGRIPGFGSSGNRDLGLEITDSGLEIRDSGLGA